MKYFIYTYLFLMAFAFTGKAQGTAAQQRQANIIARQKQDSIAQAKQDSIEQLKQDSVFQPQRYDSIVLQQKHDSVVLRQKTDSIALKMKNDTITVVRQPAKNIIVSEPTRLIVIAEDDLEFFKNHKSFQLKDNYDSDFKVEKALQALILKLYGAGFVSASVDSLVKTKGQKTAYIFIGKRYEWLDLKPGNVDQQVLAQVGFKEKQYRDKYFKFDEVETLLRDMVTYNENNGYPFATVKLDSVKIDDNMVSATMNMKRNQLIVYDTIALHGNANIKKIYLYSYLGIKPGHLYNESDVQRISKRINDLAFLQEQRPFQVVFNGKKATIHFYLTNKKSSQFDAIFGFLPNSQSTGKFLFTGDVNINLVNTFGLGQVIGLTWQKLQPGTQDLLINFEYPYLVGLPIGATANFHLYKSDTTYITIDYQIGIQYIFKGQDFLKAYVHNTLTNILNVDTNAIFNTRQLPDNNDISTNLYGVEYYKEKLNYRFNPQNGYTLMLNAGVGERKVKINNTIANLEDPENPGQTFRNLYDTIKLNSAQAQFSYAIQKFWPLGKRSTILTGTQGANILGGNLFENELFKIGGDKILRGFDEQSIFASLYNVTTAEYRYLLQKNSYFSAFFDAAYIERRVQGAYYNDFPFGFGVGVSYETKAGVFGVSYALGNQKGDPVNFRSGKIHFGYVNYF